MDHSDLFDFLPEEMRFWGVPGFSYGVMRDGQVLAKGGYGYRDIEKKLPADEKTLYGIASCSKSFNSCLIAMLVDDGILDYDRPLREYIPDFAMYDEFATRDMTLRDMLTHRTGLAPHEAMWPDPGITKKDLLMRLRYLKPNAPFRTVTQYNNTIYSAIGAVAEVVTGQSWEKLIETRIFEPLGMTSSMLSAKQMYAQPNHAQGYWNWEDGKGLTPVEPWEMDVAGGACGVVTNIEDMFKWLTLHLNNGVYNGKRLVSEKNMIEMHHPQAPMHMFPWRFPEIEPDGSYGMAWFIQYYRGRKFVWHTGEIEGFCTLEGFLPDENICIMLAMNAHKPLNMPLLMTSCYTVFDRLLGDTPIDWPARFHPWNKKYDAFYYHWDVDLFKDKPGPVPGTSTSHPLEDYTGAYAHPGYGTYQVRLHDGKPVLHFKDMLVPMEHWHYDVFRAIRIKEDTTVLTAPMSFFIGPFTGKIDGFTLQIEPTVDPAVFKRVGD
ncbi:MAG: serine hydrolase [Oscillospiraceae bacterium]|nr:serine hydrolase [Oscillospiraceae bacterium]